MSSKTQQVHLKSALLPEITFHTAAPSCLSNPPSCVVVSRLNSEEKKNNRFVHAVLQ